MSGLGSLLLRPVRRVSRHSLHYRLFATRSERFELEGVWQPVVALSVVTATGLLLKAQRERGLSLPQVADLQVFTTLQADGNGASSSDSDNPFDDATKGDDSAAKDRSTHGAGAHRPAPPATAVEVKKPSAASPPSGEKEEPKSAEAGAGQSNVQQPQQEPEQQQAEKEGEPSHPEKPETADGVAAGTPSEAAEQAAQQNTQTEDSTESTQLNTAISEEQLRIKELEEKLADHLAQEVQRLQTLLEQQKQHDAKEFAEVLENERKRLKQQWHNEIATLRKEFQQTLNNAVENERYAATLQLQQHLFVVSQENNRLLEEQLSKQAKRIWDASEEERRAQLSRDRAANIKTLEDMNVQLKSVETVMNTHAAVEASVKHYMTMFAAVEVARRALESRRPLAAPVRLLQSACGDDEFIATILGSLPSRALVKGVPSRDELVARFHEVKKQAESVALVPVGGGVFQHMLSSLVNSLSFKVDGPLEGNSVEAILSRAEAHLRSGNLDQATREVNQLSGTARDVAQGWLQDSRAYLEAKQAINVALGYISIRTTSLF